MLDDVLGGLIVVGIVLIAISPIIGILLLLIVLFRLVYRGYKRMTYRYGYVCYEESGIIRDSGSDVLNETQYDAICEMCMKNGFKVLVSFSDTDPERIMKVIKDTRQIYKNNGTPVDNLKKVY